MIKNDFELRITLDMPFAEAVHVALVALKTEGFGVLTEINVQETLKEKLDVDFRRYTILGACNPPLAYQALQNELEIGLFVPCNVIVYEVDDGGTAVARYLDMSDELFSEIISLTHDPIISPIGFNKCLITLLLLVGKKNMATFSSF